MTLASNCQGLEVHVRQISPHSLWIGHVVDVADLPAIHAAGIEALIDLGMNEPVSRITRELVYCRIPLIDGAGNRPEMLRLALQVTASLILAHVPTLVFCSAGMSRSPAIAAAALALATRAQPNECLTEVFADGPRDLSPGLWEDLMAIFRECQPRSGEIV
jgi:protein-tyrosine phosphatase